MSNLIYLYESGLEVENLNEGFIGTFFRTMGLEFKYNSHLNAYPGDYVGARKYKMDMIDKCKKESDAKGLLKINAFEIKEMEKNYKVAVKIDEDYKNMNRVGFIVKYSLKGFFNERVGNLTLAKFMRYIAPEKMKDHIEWLETNLY